jgi:hypothetical protein
MRLSPIKVKFFWLAFFVAAAIFLSVNPFEMRLVTAATRNFMALTVISADSRNEPDAEELKPKIISRKDWEAKAPVGQGKEHTIRSITIHHTATPQKKEIVIERKMQNLQKFSQTESPLANGKLKPVWFDIPYHFYIAVDGKIAEGREIGFAGDTNTNYDPTGHALIVVEGNFETEQPTDEQLTSLTKLTAWLAAKYKVPTAEIKVHNDFAATACPGVNLKKLIPGLIEKVDKIIKSTNKSN